MMIMHDDVRRTLISVDPEVTAAEVEHYFSTISDAVEARTDEVTEQLRSEWVRGHGGRQPDGLTWGQMLGTARQLAENQIRQEYLAELTEQIIQSQIDDPEDSPHLRALNSEDGWRLAPEDIQVSGRTQQILDELWLERPVDWTILAGALIERLEYLGEPYPEDWDSALIPGFEKAVDEALAQQQAQNPQR